MPYLTGLLLPVSGAPIELRVRVSKSNPTDVIKTIIGGTKSEPVATTCKIGLMFSLGGSDLNALASSICSEFSDKANETHGPCFMISEDEKGGLVNLSKESVEQVAVLYQNLTGNKPPGLSLRKPKKEQQGPKRAKKAADFFKKKFFQIRVTELRDQNLKFDMAKEASNASAAWNKLLPEEKSSYLADEAADKARLDKEMAEWVINNPPKPSRPRTATYYYNQSHPVKEDRPEYSTLNDEEKKVFELHAEGDKQRFETQLAKFKAYCESNGKDFEEEMKPKKRATVAVEKKTKTKGAEPARKHVKKQKTADGGAKTVAKSTKKAVASKTAKQKKSGDDEAAKKKRKKPVEEEAEADEAAAEEAETEDEEEEEAAEEDAGSDDE